MQLKIDAQIDIKNIEITFNESYRCCTLRGIVTPRFGTGQPGKPTEVYFSGGHQYDEFMQDIQKAVEKFLELHSAALIEQASKDS